MKKFFEFGDETFNSTADFHNWMWEKLDWEKGKEIPCWYDNVMESLAVIMGFLYDDVGSDVDVTINTYMTNEEADPRIEVNVTENESSFGTYVIPFNGILLTKKNVVCFFEK